MKIFLNKTSGCREIIKINWNIPVLGVKLNKKELYSEISQKNECFL